MFNFAIFQNMGGELRGVVVPMLQYKLVNSNFGQPVCFDRRFLNNPADSYPSAVGDTSTGGQDGATVTIGESGDWAVVNDETGEVIAVNDRNNPRQQPPRRPEEE